MNSFEKKIIIAILLLLSFVILATKFAGETDFYEYTSIAKFFAGEYSADLRSAHSLTYGLMHGPLIYLFKTFFVMKLTSLVFLILIILSVYYISGRNYRALLLFSVSPIVWYIGPWINPIQMASLLFLWGFFFVNKYKRDGKNKNLACAGLLIGLSISIWNTILFITPIFLLAFFYKEKVYSAIFFIAGIACGLIPLMVFDYKIYGLPFYSILRHFMANAVTAMYGGIYSSQSAPGGVILTYLALIVMLPLYFYKIFRRKSWRKNKAGIIFISLSLLFFLMNPQIRFLLLLCPIITIYLSEAISEKETRKQIVMYAVISVLVINPYLIQVGYSTNSKTFDEMINNWGKWEISGNRSYEDLVRDDLERLTKEYPNEVFLVGNNADSYMFLADIHWTKNVKEFVSIQDYEMYMKNEKDIFSRTIESKPVIQDRRQIWIAGGLSRNRYDKTDYEKIEFAIGVDEPIKEKDFEFVKRYGNLYLSRRAN